MTIFRNTSLVTTYEDIDLDCQMLMDQVDVTYEDIDLDCQMLMDQVDVTYEDIDLDCQMLMDQVDAIDSTSLRLSTGWLCPRNHSPFNQKGNLRQHGPWRSDGPQHVRPLEVRRPQHVRPLEVRRPPARTAPGGHTAPARTQNIKL